MSSWELMAQSLHFTDERSMWDKLYTERGMSVAQLAARFACTPHTVRLRLQKHGIKMRSRGGKNRVKFEVNDALLERIQNEGVSTVAKALGVSVQAIYRRVFYAKGLHLRPTAQPTETPEASPETVSEPLPDPHSK